MQDFDRVHVCRESCAGYSDQELFAKVRIYPNRRRYSESLLQRADCVSFTFAFLLPDRVPGAATGDVMMYVSFKQVVLRWSSKLTATPRVRNILMKDTYDTIFLNIYVPVTSDNRCMYFDM